MRCEWLASLSGIAWGIAWGIGICACGATDTNARPDGQDAGSPDGSSKDETGPAHPAPGADATEAGEMASDGASVGDSSIADGPTAVAPTVSSWVGVNVAADLPRVDIAYSYAGGDGTIVDALVAAGARGIVSAGLAPGIPTPLERAGLERARDAGVVVVQSSRAGSGRVALRRSLEEAGMVAADNLNPQKARVLLMLALTRSPDVSVIRRLFATY